MRHDVASALNVTVLKVCFLQISQDKIRGSLHSLRVLLDSSRYLRTNYLNALGKETLRVYLFHTMKELTNKLIEPKVMNFEVLRSIRLDIVQTCLPDFETLHVFKVL